jgi:ABC-2 type transport system permease protein
MFLVALTVSILVTYLSFKYLNSLTTFATNSHFTLTGTNSKERLLAYLWEFLLSTLPVFAAVFFGSPAISSEIESKTAFHVFTLPIPRSILVTGKYLASVTVTISIVLTYFIVQSIVFQYIFGHLILLELYSFLLSVGFVFAISSMTFVISSVFNKNTYAYISVLIIYLLLFNAATVIIELLYKTVPYYLLSENETIMYRVYVNVSFGITSTIPSGLPAPEHELIANLLIMFLYAVIGYGITLILFERKEVR